MPCFSHLGPDFHLCGSHGNAQRERYAGQADGRLHRCPYISGVYKTTLTVTTSTNATTKAVLSAMGVCSIGGNTITMTSGTAPGARAVLGEGIAPSGDAKRAHTLEDNHLQPDARGWRGLVDEDGHAEEFLIANWKQVHADYISAIGNRPRERRAFSRIRHVRLVTKIPANHGCSTKLAMAPLAAQHVVSVFQSQLVREVETLLGR